MIKSLLDSFVYRLAWQDTRSYRRRLMLFFSCIALGVAALVSIRSVGENLEGAVHLQAKSLLGADLSLRSRSPFNRETQDLIASIEGDVALEVRPLIAYRDYHHTARQNGAINSSPEIGQNALR